MTTCDSLWHVTTCVSLWQLVWLVTACGMWHVSLWQLVWVVTIYGLGWNLKFSGAIFNQWNCAKCAVFNYIFNVCSLGGATTLSLTTHSKKGLLVTLSIMTLSIKGQLVTLIIKTLVIERHYAECYCTECRHAEYHYAECHYACVFVLNVVAPPRVPGLFAFSFQCQWWDLNLRS